MLCLHGFNSDVESFKFMTRGIRKHLEPYCTFHYVEAPFILDPKAVPPSKANLKADFKGPFRTWVKLERAQLDEDMNIVKEDAEQRKNIIETIDYVAHAVEQLSLDPTRPVIFTGIDEGVEAIARSIREHGPFDGVLSFS